MSYANLIMYNAVIPSFDGGDTAGGAGVKDDEVVNADDPKNRDKVSKVLFG